MKALFILIFLLATPRLIHAQELKELFSKSETQITWLGIDFSHVKLIGDFKQFGEWGDNGSMDIKNKYFTWKNQYLK